MVLFVKQCEGIRKRREKRIKQRKSDTDRAILPTLLKNSIKNNKMVRKRWNLNKTQDLVLLKTDIQFHTGNEILKPFFLIRISVVIHLCLFKPTSPTPKEQTIPNYP